MDISRYDIADFLGMDVAFKPKKTEEGAKSSTLNTLCPHKLEAVA